MHFITALTSVLLTSIVVASPVALAPESAALEVRGVAGRDTSSLCQIGVPCVVGYEVNVALEAVTNATALINASAHAAISPTDPIVISLNAAVAVLVKVLGELQVEVGAEVGDAKVQLQAYVVAAISTAVGEIRAGVAIIVSVAATAGAIVTPKVTESANAVLTVIAAIEVVVGPCVPPSA